MLTLKGMNTDKTDAKPTPNQKDNHLKEIVEKRAGVIKVMSATDKAYCGLMWQV